MTDTHVNCQHAVDPYKPCDCGAGDTLTAVDVRALKHADALCFDHLADGTSRIRAILRAESSSTGFEETRSIAALDARLNDYAQDGAAGPYTAFAMIGSAKYDAVAQTLIRHLKVGSQFVLVWTRDNNNNHVKDADLHVDTLSIRVQAKGAKVADEFLIAYAVCRDNTARMVRRQS